MAPGRPAKSLSYDQWHQENENVGQPFANFFCKSIFSDVTFIVGKGRTPIPGHKLVLSTCSWEFYNVFVHVKLDTDVLLIEDVSYVAFFSFLEFCYKGTTNLNDLKDVWDILKLARRFQVKGLIVSCEKYLLTRINVKNSVVRFQRIVDFYLKSSFLPNNSVLKKKISFYLAQYFIYISDGNLLNNFPYEKMLEIVKMENLNVDEMIVFDAMIKWAKCNCVKSNIPINMRNIRLVLGDIFYEIRFPIMKMEWFIEIVATYPGLLTTNELSNIADFIRKESNTCNRFNYNLREYHCASLRDPKFIGIYHMEYQRVACYRGDPERTELYSSILYIKISGETWKCLYGFGSFRTSKATKIISCTIKETSMRSNVFVEKQHIPLKYAYWPLGWRIGYQEDYFTTPISLRSSTWYSVHIKFSEKIPVLHKESQSLSNEIFFANGIPGIPYLLIK